MDRFADRMQPPSHPSDPRATVVHVTGDTSALPEIAGYRVMRKIGQGGMATVYLATQLTLDRPVSIKVMEHGALADETSMQRFENEARTIARLSHPNIVAIHEIGRTADGRMYYSMPFLPNGDLAQHKLNQDDARIVELLRTLLSALDYAHARGIVHRDVKLENVLFDGDNRPLLADFGIAMSKHDDVRITTAGFAVGSSAYMAPEQARGDVVDGRADLYSVGVLAYELLTGALPFHSTDAFALALMHAQKEIPRLPAAKKHWQAFIDRAMAKDPGQRFVNARQMLDALDRIGARQGSRRSRRVPGGIDHAADEPSRKAWVFALLGVAVIAGGLYVFRDSLPAIGDGPAADASRSDDVMPAAATTTSAASVPSPRIAAPPEAAASPPLAPAARSIPAASVAAAGSPPIAATSPPTSAQAPAGRPVDSTPSSDPTTSSLEPPASSAVPDAPTATMSPPSGGSQDDAIDPGFVKLHGRFGIWPPAAIARTEVTRQQYAAFAAATRRPAAACGDAEPAVAAPEQDNARGGTFGGSSRRPSRYGWKRHGSDTPADADAPIRSRWNNPGYRQSGDDPVVCVSWNDATAYMLWLGERNGHRYRLPSAAEWRLAIASGTGSAGAGEGTAPATAGSPNPLGLYGLDGNVSEWLADCGLGCGRHKVAGRSWRGRGNDEIATGRASDRGFDDVGFRVVEVLADDRSRAGAGR